METMQKEVALKIENLNKTLGKKHILKNVSFETYSGEVFGFLGPNCIKRNRPENLGAEKYKGEALGLTFFFIPILYIRKKFHNPLNTFFLFPCQILARFRTQIYISTKIYPFN